MHPELEAAQQRAATAVVPLPEKSTARPYVFFDIAINKQPAGGWWCARRAVEVATHQRAGGR